MLYFSIAISFESFTFYDLYLLEAIGRHKIWTYPIANETAKIWSLINLSWKSFKLKSQEQTLKCLL